MKCILHKAFAHPYHLSGGLGTAVLAIGIGSFFVRKGLEFSHFAEISMLLAFIFWLASMTGLGYLFGAVFLAWLIVPLCRRMNGAPYKIGDKVIMLTGPKQGLTSTVCELVKGQGGQWQARIDLGNEARNSCRDTFEEFQLLRSDNPSSCPSPKL
ncbi:MAG: hypothetical protein ACAI34_01970 [Verrucomicrobium sp.]